MSKEPILEIKDLEVHYGPIRALKAINITVYEGQVVALLGANGAGKTTTLRTLSGVIKPSNGTILFKGERLDKLAPESITSSGISQSPEGRQIFGDLTVEENLKIGAYIIKSKKILKENFEKVYRYFPVLRERKNQVASTLSGGEQQMLAIGRALMNNPKVLLLDEPSLGLAPLLVKEILEIVNTIAKDGVTVVIVEQNAAQTLKIADYAYVLEVGSISKEGEAHELMNDSSLAEAYLGTVTN
ncbi:branched-chain amino acid transport system ATP-binding protein [Alkalibacterium subtropicum]|uniref:Branched-chain amino acid transport system ATP-binding protein n=1 Tax=Alkalibacterium subtropicum TaxID=753702 RepID=A0A1I1H318_9LACT|nr:branched-chain amino acid transport system ATP-binding protein [Alkalibacterium subtropicum]